MEPRIRYAKTSDGVSIAYSVMGDGDWLVFSANIWGDLQYYIHNEATRHRNDSIVASGWRTLRYDGRGMGASDRNVGDFSLETRLRDLEAVTGSVNAARFVLCGYGQGGPAAILYTVTHPERVSHLVLVNSWAKGSDYYESIPLGQSLISLSSMDESHFEFYTLTLANAGTDFSDSSTGRKLAQMMQGSMSPSSFLAYVRAAHEIDLKAHLRKVAVPTLVVDDRSGMSTGELNRFLASEIPGALFVRTDNYAKELNSFVRGLSAGPSAFAGPPGIPQGMTAILFADIVDSTAMTERFGDTAFRERAAKLDASLRAVIRAHDGTPIEGKLLGDGVLAVFTSAREAIHAALDCAGTGVERGLPLHLGVHAGDVIRDHDNVYGGAVNIAARIAAESGAGQVLVSETVRGLARTSTSVVFHDRGEHKLKGIADPQRLYEASLGERH